jgi:hypothetical protein
VRRWILDSVDVLPAWSNLVQTSGRLNAAAAIEDAQFSVANTNGWPIVIPPGDSVTIPVRYLPTKLEDATDTVVISNNDTLNSVIEISLSGRGMASQTINFPAIADQLATNVVTLSATATSGGEVTFAVSGPAVLNGNQLSFNNAGEVSVIASQAGSTYWRAAPDVTNTFMVSKVDQTINFAPIPRWLNATSAVSLVATASSGLPVDFSIVAGPGVVNGGLLTFSGVGDVVIAANQPGNSQYAAAPQVTTSAQVYEDANDNAVPDDWEVQYFEPEYEITAESDLDDDGIPDALEFIAGTDPTNPNDRIELKTEDSAPAETGNAFVLRWSSVSNRYYQIVYKTNLLETFAPVTSGLIGTPPVNVYTTDMPSTESPVYYRIGVTLEP